MQKSDSIKVVVLRLDTRQADDYYLNLIRKLEK